MPKKKINSPKSTSPKINIEQGVREIDAVRPPPAEVPTVSTYIDQWWSTYRSVGRRGRSLAQGTWLNYERYLKTIILPGLGDHRLDELSSLQLRAFLADLVEKGQGPTAVRIVRSLLDALLTAASRDQVIPHAFPVPAVQWSVACPRLNTLTFDEKEKLLVAAATPNERTLLRFAMETGVRLGELLALRPSDISIERREVRIACTVSRTPLSYCCIGDDGGSCDRGGRDSGGVHAGAAKCTTPHEEHARSSHVRPLKFRKDGRVRSVPLTDVLFNELLASHMDPGRTFLFPDASYGSVSALLSAAIERAGLRVRTNGVPRRLHFRDLRHTFAAHLVMRGVPVELICRWMGYSSIYLMEQFAHLAPDPVEACRPADASERALLLAALESTGRERNSDH